MDLRTQLALTQTAWSLDTSGHGCGATVWVSSLCPKIERAGSDNVEIGDLATKTKTLGQGIEESCWQHLGFLPVREPFCMCLWRQDKSDRVTGAAVPLPANASLSAVQSSWARCHFSHSHHFFSFVWDHQFSGKDTCLELITSSLQC